MVHALPDKAILYDFLLVTGGAELVVLELAREFDALLVVDFKSLEFVRNQKMQVGGGFSDVSTYVLGVEKVNAISRYLFGMFHFKRKTRFLGGNAWTIFSGTNAPLAVTRSSGVKLHYCFTIPRFAFDLKTFWLGKASWWQRPGLRLLAWFVKHNYVRSVNAMDINIAISETVRHRLRNCLNIDSRVIYPPVDVDRFNWLEQGDYFLSTARLEPYKRVELIVRAFLLMPQKRLIVASGGSELVQLQAIANEAPNIEFTGWVEDEELAILIGKCRASIQVPINEDFGISVVESMAAGKPVIGVNEGGLCETIVPERTGILLSANPDITQLIEAVKRMTPELALSMRSDCELRAQRFSRKIFLEAMKATIDAAVLANTQEQP